ncbi:DUF4920 domain-containing protein [uncultured Polaribacter sp.]|uniref:DUF4920 domain-containing protein n=1 Tax=uncultured Polaribacter sp. TaxID=174711 RepID=UPI003703B8CF
MKFAIQFCAVALVFFVGCKQAEKVNNLEISKVQELAFVSFGDKISNEEVVTSKEMLLKFEDMTFGDTINVKFASEIKEVCAAKGCWMKLPLTAEKEVMVRFKDYGFFMPLDSQGKEVVLEGKAFVQTTSVAELRHYAKDAGKSKEEIAAITNSKKEFSFEANGVLLKVK